MTTLIDLDIFPLIRPWTEYTFDVYIGNDWVASARNLHSADDTANEVWYRAVLAQPIASDPEDEPEEPPPPIYPHWDTPPADVNPDVPAPDEPTPDSHTRAFTAQSIATPRRIARCRICDGPHFGWQCPGAEAFIAAHACPSCGAPSGDPCDCQDDALIRLEQFTAERERVPAAVIVVMVMVV